MRVTVKGQVTIPRRVRETMGIAPETDVDFVEEDGRFYLIKTGEQRSKRIFSRLRGIAKAKMSTDEIMKLTRD